MYKVFLSLLKRDLRLAFRHKSEILNPLFFFVIVVTLFPLGISPEKQILAEIGPGIIWVAALLASMLSLESLFRSDFDDLVKESENREFCSNSCQNKFRSKRASKKFKRTYPKSLAEIHHQTLAKLVRRMNLGCSRCKWDLTTCDLHHIKGRKINDPHSHKNLSYLCPNCHRLFHNGIITEGDILDLEEHVGDTWKEFYYG